jgi:anaerobic selenocysteine-containing dehydrogenase
MPGYSQPVGDHFAYTTCYMCACRCGIKVHLRDGALRYIEGNRDHPVNRGVLRAKRAVARIAGPVARRTARREAQTGALVAAR